MNALDLSFYFSGGAANADPALALGGTKSSAGPDSQSFTAPTNVTGVTIDYAAGNGHGDGTLAYTDASTSLTWAGAGAGAGDAVDVSSDGAYLVADDSGGFIEVTVVAASLPGSDQQDADIAIAAVGENVFDDIDKGESKAGHVDYRCLYLQNDGGNDLTGVALYFAATPSGDAELALGIDPAGKNAAATTIANETTAPAGVTFSAADGAGNAVAVGEDLAPGDYVGIWLRRTVAAGSGTSVPSDTAAIEAIGSY